MSIATHKKFTWSTEETFQVVNVLCSTPARFFEARWAVQMWPTEDAARWLKEILSDVPLVEPIDSDKVDWPQVVKAIKEENAA